VLRPELPPTRAPEQTLVASLAICDALRQAGVGAGIKWQNDVLVSGRKIAGVLTGLAAEPDRVHWVVIGVGVNVNARREDFPEELRDEATSVLLERGQPAPRALLAAACFTALEDWLDRHAEEGFAPIRDAWRERSVTLGREVVVKEPARELRGIAEDIDATGALLVRGPAGLERVLAGDVTLVRSR
jgi:BirA family biotin operon repressor/biotin-[acetyl-CoA-carboxylase] ligase